MTERVIAPFKTIDNEIVTVRVDLMRTLRQYLYGPGELLRGWSIQSKLRQLRQMEYLSADRIAEWQLHRLQLVARHAYENTRFYRNLWNEAGVKPDMVRSLADLKRFPSVTKQDLMASADDAIDARSGKSGYIMGRSSGSTGERFVYYKTKDHHSWFIASNMLGWTWAGWDLGDRWVRLQLRGQLTLRQKIEDVIFNCLYMPIEEMNDTLMRTYADKIARFKPRILRGYAGGTYLFARYLLAKNDTRVRPKAVVCTGDTLYPHYRKAIEEAFGCKVFDSYGGEGMSVATQCADGSYHVLPPVYTELEGDSGVIDGEQSSRILLTSLTNYAMPMVRYDIGDVAVLAKGTCSCGRQWACLERVIGRQTDIVVTPAGNHLVCHHFNNMLRGIDGINQFQVIQEEKSTIRLTLEVNDKYNAERENDYILRELSQLGGKGLKVDIEIVDRIPIPKSGKRRYVISKVWENGYESQRAGDC